VALWRGDPTAKFAGRLTLNPIPHIDPYGSIFLPGLLMLMQANQHDKFIIGWAKPVPIDPRNFRHKYDGILVAAAGPVSNTLLAFLFAIVDVASLHFAPSIQGPMRVIAEKGLILNCLLAIFNLLPIPPLDGHWVALRLLPPNLAHAYSQIGFAGIIVIFLLLMIPVVNYTLVQLPTLFLVNTLLRLAALPFGGVS
jgi:Zn-dependent protease